MHALRVYPTAPSPDCGYEEGLSHKIPSVVATSKHGAGTLENFCSRFEQQVIAPDGSFDPWRIPSVYRRLVNFREKTKGLRCVSRRDVVGRRRFFGTWRRHWLAKRKAVERAGYPHNGLLRRPAENLMSSIHGIGFAALNDNVGVRWVLRVPR